jgi:hypothetical protein
MVKFHTFSTVHFTYLESSISNFRKVSLEIHNSKGVYLYLWKRDKYILKAHVKV